MARINAWVMKHYLLYKLVHTRHRSACFRAWITALGYGTESIAEELFMIINTRYSVRMELDLLVHLGGWSFPRPRRRPPLAKSSQSSKDPGACRRTMCSVTVAANHAAQRSPPSWRLHMPREPRTHSALHTHTGARQNPR
jgi:hypothetical protein